jgi:hypothetical protein
MSKKTLFEYAVLLHTKDENKVITDTEVIINPTTILGESEKDVIFKVTRAIPEEHAKNPDNVEILIRNF